MNNNEHQPWIDSTASLNWAKLLKAYVNCILILCSQICTFWKLYVRLVSLSFFVVSAAKYSNKENMMVHVNTVVWATLHWLQLLYQCTMKSVHVYNVIITRQWGLWRWYCAQIWLKNKLIIVISLTHNLLSDFTGKVVFL